MYRVQQALVGDKSAFVTGDLVGVYTFSGGVYEGFIESIREGIVSIRLCDRPDEVSYIKIGDICIVGDMG